MYHEEKSEVFGWLKKYHAYAEKHTGAQIGSVNVIKRIQKTAKELKALKTGNGGEYFLKSLSPTSCSTVRNIN